MSKNQTTPARDESGKFVSSADNTRRTREEQSVDEATAVLEQYVNFDVHYGEVADGGTRVEYSPRPVVSLDALIKAKAVAHPRLDPASEQDLQLVRRSIQGVLKDRATDELTRLDRLTLDTTGEHTRPWMALDIPQIVFCALTSQDTSFEMPDGTKPQAIALWFDTAVAGPWTSKRTGEITPNRWNPDGYTGIVAMFPTVAHATEAYDELRQAVRVLATPPFDGDDDEHDDMPDTSAILSAL